MVNPTLPFIISQTNSLIRFSGFNFHSSKIQSAAILSDFLVPLNPFSQSTSSCGSNLAFRSLLLKRKSWQIYVGRLKFTWSGGGDDSNSGGRDSDGDIWWWPRFRPLRYWPLNISCIRQEICVGHVYPWKWLCMSCDLISVSSDGQVSSILLVGWPICPIK